MVIDLASAIFLALFAGSMTASIVVAVVIVLVVAQLSRIFRSTQVARLRAAIPADERMSVRVSAEAFGTGIVVGERIAGGRREERASFETGDAAFDAVFVCAAVGGPVRNPPPVVLRSALQLWAAKGVRLIELGRGEFRARLPETTPTAHIPPLVRLGHALVRFTMSEPHLEIRMRNPDLRLLAEMHGQSQTFDLRALSSRASVGASVRPQRQIWGAIPE